MYIWGVEVPTCHAVASVIDNLVFIAIFIFMIPFTLSTDEVFAVSFSLMDASFTSLPKLLFTTIDATDKRFFASMRVHVLSQILLKRKLLITFVTQVRLLNFVHLHVPLQTVFSFELRFAVQYVAQK